MLVGFGEAVGHIRGVERGETRQGAVALAIEGVIFHHIGDAVRHLGQALEGIVSVVAGAGEAGDLGDAAEGVVLIGFSGQINRAERMGKLAQTPGGIVGS